MTNLYYEDQRLIDVVNEKDEPIDLRSRTEIHRLGLLHREIHVWLLDKNNNLIFQKRGLHRASAGMLDASVGGHVNKGENYTDAAIREVEEETGLKLSKKDLVLLGKIRGKEVKDFLGTINSFFREIYILKNPVDFKSLKKEKGIPGGGFQKISLKLKNFSEDLIIPFVRIKELPIVMKYLDGK